MQAVECWSPAIENAMIVLCSNPACGAVLRAGVSQTRSQVILYPGATGPHFTCPRCGQRSPVGAMAGASPDARDSEDEDASRSA